MSAHTPGRVEREKREMTEQVGDAESSEGPTRYGRRGDVAVGWDAWAWAAWAATDKEA